jgi:hypothetical protein
MEHKLCHDSVEEVKLRRMAERPAGVGSSGKAVVDFSKELAYDFEY